MKAQISLRYMSYATAAVGYLLIAWLAYVIGLSIVEGANLFIITVGVIFLWLLVMAKITLRGESLFRIISVANYCALLVLYIPSIPKIDSMPVAPKYFFFALTLALFFANTNNVRLLKINKETVALLLCILFMGLILMASGSYRGLLSLCEPIVIFLATWLAIGGRKQNALFVTKLVAALLLFSSMWLLGSIFFVEPFLSVREYLYASKVVSGDPINLLSMSRPTGLTFHHFIMGYQISIGTILAVFFFLYEKRPIGKIFAGAAFFVMVLGMLLSGQRSAMVAVSGAILVYIIMKKRYKIAVLLFAITVIAMLFTNKIGDNFFGGTLPWGTTQSKFISASDAPSRFGWQIAALRSMTSSPLGHILEGKSWDVEAIEEGADFSEFGYTTKAIHNSYIGTALKYGWIGGALIFSAIFLLIRSIVRNVSTTICCDKYNTYFVAVGIALLAGLIQALFHNASIFTSEPSSCVILCLFLVWSDMEKRAKRLESHVF